MIHIRISPEEYPPKQGESWWVVHPNSEAEFRVPMGAVTCCTSEQSFLGFEYGTVYPIVGCDNHNGWITLRRGEDLVDMPQYLYSRHFDAEAFVVGHISPAELERAKPFDYKPTLPKNFKDSE